MASAFSVLSMCLVGPFGIAGCTKAPRGMVDISKVAEDGKVVALALDISGVSDVDELTVLVDASAEVVRQGGGATREICRDFGDDYEGTFHLQPSSGEFTSGVQILAVLSTGTCDRPGQFLDDAIYPPPSPSGVGAPEGAGGSGGEDADGSGGEDASGGGSEGGSTGASGAGGVGGTGGDMQPGVGGNGGAGS